MEHITMKFISLHTVCLLLLTGLPGIAQGAEAARQQPTSARPNILLIVADDVGYSDIGAFGSEISTPNIDALAAKGILLTQFHVSPNCGPTRGSMMTGVDPHRAGMGGNHGANAKNQDGQPGYEGHLRADVVTIAQLLRDAGYHTYMTGKWHLGNKHNAPQARGFERSFALLNGAASHWSDQGAIIPGSKTRYVRDDQAVNELPDSFYSSAYYTDEMISYIDAAGDDKPFFAYLSYTAPHNPLHAPRGYIEKYRGRYDGGWDKLAASRLARLQTLGLPVKSAEPQPRPSWIMAWDELTAKQQSARARDMEIYAAMIDYLDSSMGRLLEHLKNTGKYDNTLIVFMSDNGPSRTSILDYLSLGGDAAEFFKQYDNSLGNKGFPGSSTDIGPGWAYAAATPLRLFKGYVAQGGIQVPAVVKPPGGMVQPGRRSDQLVHVMDLMPTFLSLAGAKYPDTYQGKPIVPLLGKSFAPLLQQGAGSPKSPRGIGWAAYGMYAYRQGDWKVIKLPEPYGNNRWQLYNLASDPGELHDLASNFPDRTLTMASAWEDYARSNGVIIPSNATFYAKPVANKKF
jgi:arylsulfatase